MLKRIIPFILTFVISLIVASFFVSIVPSFKFKRGGHRKHEQLRYENERLRVENERLKAERAFEINEVPDVDFDVPPPPPMPKKVK
jgi:hypothetical protein